jgi:GT2 family glycosyltransferase
MTIDIIIPNYNGSALIEKNLPKVISAVLDYKNLGIIIVDDSSEKNDQEALKLFVRTLKQTSKVPIRLLSKKRNEGFASTANKGAYASQADILVLLNSDVVPEKNFLDHPLEILEARHDVFGVGCMDKSVEGDTIVERGRGTGFWRNGFFQHKAGKLTSERTLWISGGSSIMRGDLFRQAGGFDTRYNPFYWEDIDLSYRMQKLGYSVLFDRKSVVIHEHEKGAIKKHFTSQKVQEIAYRNQLIFHWKNLTDIDLILAHIIWLPVTLLKSLLRGDTAFLKGFFSAILLLPSISTYRIKNRSKIVRTDKQLLDYHKD